MYAVMGRGSNLDRRDEVAFEALMTANFRDVWSFVRRRTPNSSDADDVTAQVFTTAWRRRSDMPLGNDQRLWLFGVTRLSLSNHHRSARRQTNLHLRLIETTTAATAEPEEVNGRLASAMAALSIDDRDVLMMRAWDGLAVSEIADLLGCTANAASLRLHKARRRLEVLLDQKDHAEGGHVSVEPTAEERK